MTLDPDCPTVQQLWDRTLTRRKPGRICDVCKEEVASGAKYQSSGYIFDGKFETWIRHYGAEQYPSGCPKFHDRDLAEINEHHRKDELLFASPSNPPEKETRGQA